VYSHRPNLRIAFVDTLYPAFTAAHYADRPGLAERPYVEQLEALMERSFGTSDAYSVNLRSLGEVAVDLLVNVAPLQHAWAREHGMRVRGSLAQALPGRLRSRIDDPRPRRIAMAQIADLAADVVYCQDLWFFRPDELRELRADGRLVVGQIASAPPDEDVLREFDLLLTSFPHYVDRFRALGVDSEYFRIGFDQRVLDRLHAMGVPTDAAASGRDAAAFVGGVDPRLHGDGVARWEALLDRVPFEVYGYGGERLPAASTLRRAWQGEAWGLSMYAVLARAGIALNRHIAAAEGYANNMRLYEATGVGALLLTEAAPNLAELFEPGREVVAYGSDEELVELLRHYLAHPDARREIAAAGQRRTLSEHTYAQRMVELQAILAQRR
jgi:spore maturation protein CgeB